MAYDNTKPADDGYLADAPAELREAHRALKEDRIVDAVTVKGLSVGYGEGQIPVSDGTVCRGLNADKLDGNDATAFAGAVHDHTDATVDTHGYLSTADKRKLDGLSVGAEVNQNAFARVSDGTRTLEADAKQDLLTLRGSGAVTVIGEPSTDTVTVGVVASDSVSSTSSTNVASSKAVKAAYDVAVDAKAQSLTVKGVYTGSGGQINPKDLNTYSVQFNMMNTPLSGDNNYKDCLLMNCYGDSDIRYRTMFAVLKAGGNTRAWIATAGSADASWANHAELITTKNIASQSVATAASAVTCTGNAATATRATAAGVADSSKTCSGNAATASNATRANWAASAGYASDVAIKPKAAAGVGQWLPFAGRLPSGGTWAYIVDLYEKLEAGGTHQRTGITGGLAAGGASIGRKGVAWRIA